MADTEVAAAVGESDSVTKARKLAEEAEQTQIERGKEALQDVDASLTVYDGDVPETLVTNAMSDEPGFPARTEDGDLVDIVAKLHVGGGRIKLVDIDGGEWEDSEGTLIAWDEETGFYNKPAETGEAASSKTTTKKTQEKQSEAA